ncbi:DoxX family protein [Glycomyces sp. L485]|uniref:DoxX family protein n=1 Tax=Glycomyces sp. L485 TaxID=2909235 RepID=UPI001F4BA278|nr:DoxX family protein [Glycomyces sp. L485]MCH7230912.1 DoxX family protein [Glycomyces sp. L485]
MNVFLWILQGLLAAILLMVGMMKLFQPKEKIAGMMPVFEPYSARAIRLIGIAELAAAAGLILPAVTGVAVVLTPLAAVGIVVLMILASMAHGRRKETSMIMMTMMILILAAIVAWGRFGPYAF